MYQYFLLCLKYFYLLGCCLSSVLLKVEKEVEKEVEVEEGEEETDLDLKVESKQK